MFSLSRQTVRLASVNPRAELHGEERIPAVDLKIDMKVSNDVLSEFDSALKGSLYMRGEADLVDDPGHLPVLRFPLMSAFKWGKEFVGYALRIHWGVSGRDDIVLLECGVDGFRFECMEGGSVAVCFRVQAHPDEHDFGRLCALVQQDVDISLDPPEAGGAND